MIQLGRPVSGIIGATLVDRDSAVGFTWYSLIDQVDWDTELAEKNDRVFACGLYDLGRKPRRVEADFRAMVQEFGRISLMPHGEMLELTGRPAELEVEV